MENGIEIISEIYERYVMFNVKVAIKTETITELQIKPENIMVDIDNLVQESKGVIKVDEGIKLLFGDFIRNRAEVERTFRVQCYVTQIRGEKRAIIPKLGVEGKLEL